MRLILTYTILLTLISSCKKPDILPPVAGAADKMVLIYLAANNDLRLDAIQSLKKIQNGYSYSDKNRIVVYTKTSSEHAYLLSLQGNNKIDTLFKYVGENSSDPIFMERVIADSRKFVPASSYGLVLWSHATSWKPARNQVTTKSFGDDNGTEMDLQDLAQSLPKDFEYIIFDACSMASLEVAYQLRNHADFLLASPTEILSTGLPYHNLSNYLFNGANGLVKVAEQFMSYYDNQQGLYQSAAITLIDNKKLEAIANEAKKLLVLNTPTFPFHKHEIQELTFDTSNNMPSYDFLSFLKHNFTEEEYRPLQKSIEKAIVYKNHTSRFLDYEIFEYCGISVYLPDPNDRYAAYYQSLMWSRDSEWGKLFQ